MSKIKIEEIALEVGASDKDVLAKAKELGYKVRAKNSTLDENEAMILVDYVMYGKVPDSMKKDLKIEKATKSDTDDKSIKKSTVCKNKEVAQESSLVEDKEETTPKQPKKRSGIQMTPKIIEKVEEKPEVEVNVTEESSSTAEEKPAEEKPKIEPKKRRGITIVKKKNPVVEKKKVVESKPSSIAVVKKSTKKKKVPVSAKESGEKLDIMSDRGLGGGSEVYEDQEVMMLDFSDKTILEDAQREEEQRREAARKRAIKGGQKSFVNNNFNNKPAGRRKKKKRDYKKVKDQEEKKIDIVKIPEDVRVYEFAEKIGKSVGEIITVLFTLGTIVTKNDFLDKDSIEILADEFEVEVETINPLDELDYVAQYDEEEDKDAVERAPVITIMGHVDHGKTSLLDKIREAKVAAKEAGGITQHVGAYQVEKSGKKITFIDTPGHSAFTEMRARGARSTDIAIIVVAADDGVMPQTRESISHAQAADVPIIVAVNKIDKPTANIDNVKSQLAELGITPVDWGGEHEFMPVSAHTGEGIDDLLETILLQAEIMELKADPSRYAKAIVIESLVEKGLGSVANIIVQNGSLSVGDNVIVGTTFGKVRTLILDDGSRVKKIGPSTPAALIGLDELPNAGDLLVAMDNAKDTVELAKKRKDLARAKELSKSTKVSFDELSDLIAEGKIKKLPLIIKADVQGSLEAIKKALEELKNDEVEVQVIHSGVGAISESDVILADASEHSLIAGFNVRPTGAVKSKAKEIGVEIKTYSVIYEIVDDVKALLGGLMSPVESEETLGQAEVRQTFAVAKVGTIAGCFVIDGKIERNSNARLIRDGVVIYTTQLSSLKRFNDDVKEVGKGYECGIMLENYNDLKEGDIIEIFKTVQEQVTL